MCPMWSVSTQQWNHRQQHGADTIAKYRNMPLKKYSVDRMNLLSTLSSFDRSGVKVNDSYPRNILIYCLARVMPYLFRL